VPVSIVPFTVNVPEHDLHALEIRLSLTRFPEAETVADWRQGTPLVFVHELVDYWRSGYDWRRCEAELNRWPQFRAKIDGLDIHFLHVRSPRQDAKPLIITHGWPGSVLEFLDIIGPLTDPDAYGLPGAEAFHLVLPSLPGFGFSEKPASSGWSVEKTADAWAKLMRALGYDRYFAQGGDWGSMITAAIGTRDEQGCAGIHLNMVMAPPPPDLPDTATPYELQALARLGWYRNEDNGYARIQSTRPQTIGYALTDSPVGQLAWIVEKFHGWSDCKGHPQNIFTKDQLLDHVTLYWLTATAASSARLYWESFNNTDMAPVNVPTGCSLFPMEIARPSRRWAETRFKNIVYWNELHQGGHFAAMEQPELFVEELRNCFGAMSL
jgi:epoxide hydrolase